MKMGGKEGVRETKRRRKHMCHAPNTKLGFVIMHLERFKMILIIAYYFNV
jgi:hypothetical protein